MEEKDKLSEIALDLAIKERHKETTKKETLGSIAASLREKSADDTHTADEQMRENLTKWENDVFTAAENGFKQYRSDFFIEVITKKEPLFDNVFRNYFIPRLSCPTPNYDQTVYQYIYSSDAIKYLWTVPDKLTTEFYMKFPEEVPQEEAQLLGYTLCFFDGSLDRLCRKLNKEPGDTPYLQNLNVVIQ